MMTFLCYINQFFHFWSTMKPFAYQPQVFTDNCPWLRSIYVEIPFKYQFASGWCGSWRDTKSIQQLFSLRSTETQTRNQRVLILVKPYDSIHQFSIIYIRILNDILLEIYDNCKNIDTLIPYISILSILIGQSVDISTLSFHIFSILSILIGQSVDIYISYIYCIHIYIYWNNTSLCYFGLVRVGTDEPNPKPDAHGIDIVPRVLVSSWHFLGNYSSTVVIILLLELSDIISIPENSKLSHRVADALADPRSASFGLSWESMLVAVETVEVVGVEPVWSQVEEQITSAPFSCSFFGGHNRHNCWQPWDFSGDSWAREEMTRPSCGHSWGFGESPRSSDMRKNYSWFQAQVPPETNGSIWKPCLSCVPTKHLPNAIGRNAQKLCSVHEVNTTFFYPSNYPSNSLTDREQDWLKILKPTRPSVPEICTITQICATAHVDPHPICPSCHQRRRMKGSFNAIMASIEA